MQPPWAITDISAVQKAEFRRGVVNNEFVKFTNAVGVVGPCFSAAVLAN